MIGGSFSLNANAVKKTNSTEINRRFGLNLNPEFSFAVAKNVTLGFIPGFGYDYLYRNYRNPIGVSPTIVVFKNHTFSIQPKLFARVYKMFKGKVGIYGQGTIGTQFDFGRTNDLTSGAEDKYFNGFTQSIAFNPGFVWFITDKIMFQAAYGQLGYDLGTIVDRVTFDVVTINHRLNANFGLSSLNIGAQFVIGPRTKKVAE